MVPRRGVGIVEVLVIVVIVAVVGLALLMALPRSRATARLANCQRNLSEIGVAMALYQNAQNHLPTVPSLGPDEPPAMSGPLAVLLQTLNLGSFVGLIDPKLPLPRTTGPAPSAPLPLPGLLCPADPAARTGTFPAPVSYRATTGGQPDGSGGVFATGDRPRSLVMVEAADGLAYTAAFSERRLGNGRPGTPAPENYAMVPGPVRPDGCPEAPADAWHGDAGATWGLAGWAWTLYSHALPPGGEPSCIAGDLRTARMGASSGHLEGVNVLKCDLSVATYSRRVDPVVWRALADIDEAPDATPPVLQAPPVPEPTESHDPHRPTRSGEITDPAI